MKEYYTPEEIADLLGYNTQTIYARCRKGDIKALQLTKGGLWKIPKEEVIRLKGYIEDIPENNNNEIQWKG